VKKAVTRCLLIANCYLLFACANPADPPQTVAPLESGYGTVSVAFTGGLARTVFPVTVFDSVLYAFARTDGGEMPAEIEPADGVYTLPVGAWKVTVTAYKGAVSEINKAAAGELNFDVADGEHKQIRVPLSAAKETGRGTFSYGIQYPEDAVAAITLLSLADPPADDDGSYDPTVTLYPVTSEPLEGNRISSQTELELDAGLYLLSVQLTLGPVMRAGKNEVVHIYDKLTSEFGTAENPIIFTMEDIARPVLTGTVTINGTTRVGQTLTVAIDSSNGTGTPQYQWLRGDSTVIGGNQNSYVLVPDDMDQVITAKVTYQDHYGEIVSSAAEISAGIVSSRNLAGLVTAPVTGEEPVTAPIDQAQYTGAIVWEKIDDSVVTGNFDFSTDSMYRAVLTLTAKPGWTFAGVPANAFSYAGAKAVVNEADSGTVYLIFRTNNYLNLKDSFGITALGLEGVTATFNAIHNHLAGKTAAGVESKGVILLGDYIDLESLTVNGYAGGVLTATATEGYINIAANSTITGSLNFPPFSGYEGTLLRLIVVGVNSFNGKNGNGTDAHLVFQFQNALAVHRMHSVNTVVDYTATELREYLAPVDGKDTSGAYLTGLINAGVPNNWLWAPVRQVGRGGNLCEVNDKLWLPTQWEIYGRSNSSAENATNQARLLYYSDAGHRTKYYTSPAAYAIYWLASASASSYYRVTSANGLATENPLTGSATGTSARVSPAFCVK
jgi:hypothetical protein